MRQMYTSLKGKTVLITGASSGIGEACAKLLAAEGSRLILVARRKNRLEELSRNLSCETLCLQLDVREKEKVFNFLENLPGKWSQIDVLINNAGLSRGLDKLHEGSIESWEEMIDTNLKGLLYVSRTVIPGMVKRNSGHVVNLGSIAGHQTYPGGNVYCATKAGVRALSEGMKIDLLGTNVRVTSVDPGMVETEFSEVRFNGDKERAKNVYKGLKPLSADDIADAVLYALKCPAHVNISEMIILPTAQASATLAHRE